jgi:phosphoribosylcarboxyaminoimidazole (NCAIR) mutase
MAVPSIATCPAAPNRLTDAEAAWITASDTFFAYMGGIDDTYNTYATSRAAAMLTDGFIGSSSTSFAIGTGSKAFTVSALLQFAANDYVAIASAANPANYMFGQVTSYSGTTLTVNVTGTGGSGTKTDWIIALSKVTGEAGANGTNGTDGSKGDWTTLATTAASGASVTFSSISSAYRDLEIIFDAVSGSSAATFSILASADGGSTTASNTVTSFGGGSDTVTGEMLFIDYNFANGIAIVSGMNLGAAPTATSYGANPGLARRMGGAINWLQATVSAGTFDSGNFILRAR